MKKAVAFKDLLTESHINKFRYAHVSVMKCAILAYFSDLGFYSKDAQVESVCVKESREQEGGRGTLMHSYQQGHL